MDSEEREIDKPAEGNDVEAHAKRFFGHDEPATTPEDAAADEDAEDGPDVEAHRFL